MAYVLVVEDDPRMADTLASMVRLLGYDATTVHNARMAIEAATFERPELILLDLNLPGISGVEVCRFIKRDPLLGETPVIFVSVESEPSIIKAARKAGAADYLVKPIGVDELETTIAQTFAQLGAGESSRDKPKQDKPELDKPEPDEPKPDKPDPDMSEQDKPKQDEKPQDKPDEDTG